jgi:hypothetical protein
VLVKKKKKSHFQAERVFVFFNTSSLQGRVMLSCLALLQGGSVEKEKDEHGDTSFEPLS